MTKKTSAGFVVCLRNEGAEDLEVRKVYPLVRDDEELAKGFLRVIDESGEDYLYPIDLFAAIEIADGAASKLLSASTNSE